MYNCIVVLEANMKKFRHHGWNYVTHWSGPTFFGGWRRGRKSQDEKGEMWKGGRVDGDGVRRGGVRRSARTTRSICMLGDVDHVGRGWPAAPGCWLASGHPNATPTPTHAVLSSPRAIQPPCTSTVVPPQLAGQGVMRGCGSHNSGQRDSTYYPLTLLPNSVE